VKEENVEKLPLYQCHKKVRAFKIKKIVLAGYGKRIIPENPNYDPFFVSYRYMRRNAPQEGDYFVINDNGHASFSQAKDFEEGYSLIEEETSA
jgi:hypothetical protein